MKKKLKLLLLISILFNALLLNAQYSQTFDLKPRLEKGDTWNVEVEFNAPGLELFSGNNPTSQELNINTKWKVTCIEASDENVLLKFSLLRLQQNTFNGSDNNRILAYSDTDFPLNLSKEHRNIINGLLSKSQTLEVPWDKSKAVKLLENDFAPSEIKLPLTSFHGTKSHFLYDLTLSFPIDKLIGGEILKTILEAQRGIYPNKKVAIGERWNSVISSAGKEVSIDNELMAYENGVARVKSTTDGKEFKVLLHSNSCFAYDYSSPGSRIFTFNQKGNNTWLTGNVGNGKKGKIQFTKIFPIDSEETVTNVNDGEFTLSLNLSEPVLGQLNYGGKSTKIFIAPGANLQLGWIGENPQITGKGAADANAAVAVKRLSWNYQSTQETLLSLQEKSEAYRKSFEDIVTDFGSRISEDCKQYILTEGKYNLARVYAEFTEDIQREKLSPKGYCSNPEKFDLKEAEKHYSFFMNAIDTMLLLDNTSKCSEAYHDFILTYLKLKHGNFMFERGRRRSKDNFQQNLLFASIQYVGYPYYYACYKILEEQILKGKLSELETELQNYYSECYNPVFKHALQKLIADMEVINPEQAFPFSAIKDMDGKAIQLPKGELCIVDLRESFSCIAPQHKSEKKELMGIISGNNKLDKINYVVVRAAFAKNIMQETPSNDTINFVHIYLPENDLSVLKKCQVKKGERRILLLDKNLKIINNNLDWIEKYSGHDLPKVLDAYFDSLNKPLSQADNRRLLLFGLAGLLVFGLLSWLIIRIRTQQIAKREQARRKLSELELRAIRSQMNPHFIFNALGSIQNLINQNNSKNANLYLSRFARLMRMVLATSNQRLVSLSDEIDLLKHYLELEQLRINLGFEIAVDDNIDPEAEEIPGMLIQPFVENAVIHGITPKGAGVVQVNFARDNGTLHCEIVDDGVGIENALLSNGNGIAMKFSEKRLNLLNSQLKTKMQLSIENRMETEQKSGTRVKIIIPV